MAARPARPKPSTRLVRYCWRREASSCRHCSSERVRWRSRRAEIMAQWAPLIVFFCVVPFTAPRNPRSRPLHIGPPSLHVPEARERMRCVGCSGAHDTRIGSPSNAPYYMHGAIISVVKGCPRGAPHRHSIGLRRARWVGRGELCAPLRFRVMERQRGRRL